MEKQKASNIFDLLITQELQFAELYQLMAEQYPEHRELLTKMCREEREQASQMEYLTMQALSEDLRFEDVTARAAALRSCNMRLAELICLMRVGSMTFGRALRLSMDSEKAMIDSRVLDHVGNASVDLKRLFLAMKERASEHIVRLRTLWIRNNSMASTRVFA
jgi:hypothetical protein